MEKICVFCGERPESKTLEHVIPNWLIELTGDPKRSAYFGFNRSDEGKYSKRIYSFDSFKFPACGECNSYFSSLEGKTKGIVLRLISEEPLSESELNTLLDWFDKVRIGLWLGYMYLNRNELGVEPHFYISNRIGLNDRMLLILKSNDSEQGLNAMGCDTPSFGFTPSCFSLRINNYCFLNMSLPNLVSRRIGFPYPKETFLREDDKIMVSLVKGRNRVMKPILKKNFKFKGTELYQPIFKNHMIVENSAQFMHLYDSEYVRNNCAKWEKGIGRIFIANDSNPVVYSKDSSKEWIPKKSYSFKELLFNLQIITLEWQLYIDSLQASIKLVSKEFKQQINRNRRLARFYNKEIIKYLRST